MPELPEVETVRRGLAPVLEGRRFLRVAARRDDLRIPLPRGFADRLRGRRVARVGRRAKYLLIRLEGEPVRRAGEELLLVHLGMSGRMRVEPGPARAATEWPDPHDHVRFETDDGAVIHYRDPRRFGLLTILRAEEAGTHPLLAGLGLEPLADEFDARALEAALANSGAAVKSALLDQRRIAGLGNIYACESLFRARLSPRRRAATIKGARAARLACAIREVLNEAIAAGGSSLRDHRRASGELGTFQHRFAVYGREGAPCPGCDCGGGVRRIVQGGRSTFFCARRQR